MVHFEPQNYGAPVTRTDLETKKERKGQNDGKTPLTQFLEQYTCTSDGMLKSQHARGF